MAWRGLLEVAGRGGEGSQFEVSPLAASLWRADQRADSELPCLAGRRAGGLLQLLTRGAGVNWALVSLLALSTARAEPPGPAAPTAPLQAASNTDNCSPGAPTPPR